MKPHPHARWEKALQQLRPLKYCPATAEMKARTIIAKTYAGAFYGIEAAEVALGRIHQLTAVAIDVFRSRNDNHNIDLLFAAFLSDEGPRPHRPDHHQKSPATGKNGLRET